MTRIHPLKDHLHPMFHYSDHEDPTHESLEELPETEIRARVAGVVHQEVVIAMDHHPRMFNLRF
ncbi:hypothetical protein BAE44_0010692 [Dichanthelium oligosanthes]|uniref:Uncharacterized protein n=1 Tax=Dichanthelium oligosanthes TaxID=888268 RepID=A0A1E5VT43_9POAL|nr:hypothetical protein BAE44_0010692 [Dichanthelium oligosanthes]